MCVVSQPAGWLPLYPIVIVSSPVAKRSSAAEMALPRSLARSLRALVAARLGRGEEDQRDQVHRGVQGQSPQEPCRKPQKHAQRLMSGTQDRARGPAHGTSSQ